MGGRTRTSTEIKMACVELSDGCQPAGRGKIKSNSGLPAATNPRELDRSKGDPRLHHSACRRSTHVHSRDSIRRATLGLCSPSPTNCMARLFPQDKRPYSFRIAQSSLHVPFPQKSAASITYPRKTNQSALRTNPKTTI